MSAVYIQQTYDSSEGFGRPFHPIAVKKGAKAREYKEEEKSDLRGPARQKGKVEKLSPHVVDNQYLDKN